MAFQKLLQPYTIINFLFAFLKLLANIENAYWNWKHFQCQNFNFRVFEAGYWKVFKKNSK